MEILIEPFNLTPFVLLDPNKPFEFKPKLDPIKPKVPGGGSMFTTGLGRALGGFGLLIFSTPAGEGSDVVPRNPVVTLPDEWLRPPANDDNYCPNDDFCKKRQLKLEQEKQFLGKFYSGPTGTIVTAEQARKAHSEWAKNFNMRASSHNRSCPEIYRVEPVDQMLL